MVFIGFGVHFIGKYIERNKKFHWIVSKVLIILFVLHICWSILCAIDIILSKARTANSQMGEKRRENKWNKNREHWSARIELRAAAVLLLLLRWRFCRTRAHDIFSYMSGMSNLSLSLCVLDSIQKATYAINLSGRIKSKLPKFSKTHVEMCWQCPAIPKKCMFCGFETEKWRAFSAEISKKSKITKSPVQKVPPNSWGIDWTIHIRMHVSSTHTHTHRHARVLAQCRIAHLTFNTPSGGIFRRTAMKKGKKHMVANRTLNTRFSQTSSTHRYARTHRHTAYECSAHICTRVWPNVCVHARVYVCARTHSAYRVWRRGRSREEKKTKTTTTRW